MASKAADQTDIHAHPLDLSDPEVFGGLLWDHLSARTGRGGRTIDIALTEERVEEGQKHLVEEALQLARLIDTLIEADRTSSADEAELCAVLPQGIKDCFAKLNAASGK